MMCESLCVMGEDYQEIISAGTEGGVNATTETASGGCPIEY